MGKQAALGPETERFTFNLDVLSFTYPNGQAFARLDKYILLSKRVNCKQEITMNYAELIENAMKGRPTLAMSKLWGLPNSTLVKYVKGERMPDFNTALKIVKEAGVDPAIAFEALAEEERNHKSKNFKLQLQDNGGPPVSRTRHQRIMSPLKWDSRALMNVEDF